MSYKRNVSWLIPHILHRKFSTDATRTLDTQRRCQTRPKSYHTRYRRHLDLPIPSSRRIFHASNDDHIIIIHTLFFPFIFTSLSNSYLFYFTLLYLLPIMIPTLVWAAYRFISLHAVFRNLKLFFPVLPTISWFPQKIPTLNNPEKDPAAGTTAFFPPQHINNCLCLAILFIRKV